MSRLPHFLLPLLIAVFSCPLLANPFQPPVPLTEEAPIRILGGAIVSTNFSNVQYLGAGIAFTQLIGESFEWGANLGSGAGSDKLFNGGVNSGLGNAGLMFRFLGEINSCTHIGFQTGIGYTHDFSNIARAGNMIVNIGIPLSWGLEEIARIFVMPGVDLGATRPGEEGFVFGSAVGGSVQVGTLIKIGGPGILVSVRPKVTDFKQANLLNADFMVGVSYDM